MPPRTRNSVLKRTVAASPAPNETPKRRRQSPRNQIVLDSAEPEEPEEVQERSVMQVMMEQLKTLQDKVSSMEGQGSTNGSRSRSARSSTPSETTPEGETLTSSTLSELSEGTYLPPSISFTSAGRPLFNGDDVHEDLLEENDVSKALMYLITRSNASALFALQDTKKRGKGGLTKKQLETLKRYNFSGDEIGQDSDKLHTLKALNELEERANIAVESLDAKWHISDIWNHMLHDLNVNSDAYTGTWFQRRYRLLQELYGSNYRRDAVVELSKLKPEQFSDAHSFFTCYAWLWILGGTDGHVGDLYDVCFGFFTSDSFWTSFMDSDLEHGGWVRQVSDDLLDSWAERRAIALAEQDGRGHTKPKRVRPAKKTQSMKRDDLASVNPRLLRDRYHSNRCFKCGRLGHQVKNCDDGEEQEVVEE